jgi:tetratricopeptide (TPR) repeat protein
LRHGLIAALTAVYPDDGFGNPALWSRCASLTPHLLTVCEGQIADPVVSVKCADLLDRAQSYFAGRAAFSQARQLCERALAIREKVLGPEHRDTAMSLNHLAGLLDPAAGRLLYERALRIFESELGPEHPDTAIGLANLGVQFLYQDDFVSAKPLLERALAIREKTLGDHHHTATNLAMLGRLLHKTGNPTDAEPLFRRAISVSQRALGPKHSLTQLYAGHYARFLLETARPAEALPVAQNALSIHELGHGPKHPWTITCAKLTADALCALGRADDAAKLRVRYGLLDDAKS